VGSCREKAEKKWDEHERNKKNDEKFCEKMDATKSKCK
jgi:hypothetical protein